MAYKVFSRLSLIAEVQYGTRGVIHFEEVCQDGRVICQLFAETVSAASRIGRTTIYGRRTTHVSLCVYECSRRIEIAVDRVGALYRSHLSTAD